MTASLKRPPALLYALSACLLVLAAGALYGGWLLITDPSGLSLQMPVTHLQRGPFQDFFIPGLILFAVLGIGPVLVTLALWLRPRWRWLRGLERLTREHWAWSAALAVGAALVIWIAVQLLLVDFFWLQPALLALGLVILALGLSPALRRHYAT